MKRTLALVVLVSGLFLAWPILSVVGASQAQVTAPITVGWHMRSDGPTAALLPSGSPLQQHPSYVSFQQGVTAEVVTQIPADIRNAWPFHKTTVQTGGFKPEEEVRQEIDAALEMLNNRRAEIAAQAGQPDPPDFSLATAAPEVVEYTYWNDTRTCSHMYKLSLGGTPWTQDDPTIPAEAFFFVEMSWDSRIN